MAVLLLILKILLIIIAVLLFLCFYILFVPFKLQLELGKNNELYFNGRFFSFFKFLMVEIDFAENKFTHNETVFWKTIKLKFGNTKHKKDTEDDNSKSKSIKRPNSSTIMFVLGLIKKLLRINRLYIKYADVTYSMGEPDKTGITTGIISTLPITYGDNVSIEPDFLSEDAYFNGSIILEAKVFMFTLLSAFIKIKTEGQL